MTVFVLSVAVVLVVSAICSVTEASFYAVRVPFIRQITEDGSRSISGDRVCGTYEADGRQDYFVTFAESQ